MSEETRASSLYEFGPFVVDGGRRRRLRGGETVQLTRKEFETLLVLVRGGGRVVEKGELMEAIWPGTYVEEGNLAVHVSRLRSKLGRREDGEPYIETEAGRGYRLSALVREVLDFDLVVRKRSRARFVTEESEDSDAPEVVGQAPLVPVPTGEGRGAEAALSAAPGRKELEGSSETGRGHGRRAGRVALALAACAFLLGGAGLLLYLRESSERKRPSPASAIKSIAVLPFKSLNPGEEGENYLGVGLADALITRLGGLGQVRVRPTSAVLRFDGRDRDSLAAARALGVDAVLEGSYQRSGDRIRVTVQLVSASDGTQLWAGSFDERSNNIFALQDSISAEAARSLVDGLSEAEERRLARRPTENVEAYEHYMKGRYFWGKRTSEDGLKAVSHFEQAIALDPNYAAAYSGLADCYALRSAMPPGEALSRAKAAALKAVELDDTLAEPHASLGVIRELLDFDRAGAEAEYRRAIELNPDYALARGWYAMLLTNLGRFEEGAEQARRAKELDPTSPSLHIYAAWNFYHSRQFDRSIEEARKAIALDPNIKTCAIVARAYAGKGLYEEAITEGLRAKEVRSNQTHPLGVMGYVYAAAGRSHEAREILAQLRESAGRGNASSYDLALIHAGLGEKSEAIRYLEASYGEREDMLPFLNVDPLLDTLRPDPRFAELLRRLRFAQ